MSIDTLVHCFQKCGFKKYVAKSTTKDSKIDEEFDDEFATLLNQLRDDVDDITIKDFTMFDDNVTTSPGQINSDLIAWWEKALEEAIEDVIPNDLDINEGQNSKPVCSGQLSVMDIFLRSRWCPLKRGCTVAKV